MAAFLNRPLAGTLMGAVAVGAAAASSAPPTQYYEQNPGVSASPANKFVLGIRASGTDPFATFGGPGCYVMKAPAVQGARFKAWGGTGRTDRNGGFAQPGFMQADFRLVPGELLFVILGMDGGAAVPTAGNDPALVMPNRAALGGPGIISATDSSGMGGGFTAVFRLTEKMIADFNVREPAQGAMFERYAFRERIPDLLAGAVPLILAAGSGGGNNAGASNSSNVAGGRGGYAQGEDGKASNALIGYGGTQFAGGGTASTSQASQGAGQVGQSGSKYQGGAANSGSTGRGGCGGGGFFGGGGGGSNGSATEGSGGGGSNFIDQKLAFSVVAPTLGQPATDDDTPTSISSGTGSRYQGKLVVLWDTLA